MSPLRCPSKLAKTVPSSKGLARSEETQVPAGSPGIAPATSVQLPPPSRVTWSRPSSLPTHTTCGSSGDSLIA